jgi:vacuolar-type H+-ATPase subunit I/STV1
MPFGPTPMRRIYLAVPTKYEDDVLSRIGELGVVQLIKEFQAKRPQRDKIIDMNSRFARLNEKLDAILGKEAIESKSESTPEHLSSELTCKGAESFIEAVEPELNGLISLLDELEEEVKEAESTKDKLRFLVTNGLRTDDIGVFRHIFVKVGFVKASLSGKLATYFAGTSLIPVVLVGRPRENFIIIAGLNEDRPFSEDTLKTLNFEEITFPENLNGDSRVALEKIESKIRTSEDRITQTKEEMKKMKLNATSYDSCLREAVRYEEAKQIIMRTGSRSLIHGWIPLEDIESLRAEIERIVPKDSVYLDVKKPKLEDKVPVEYRSKGIVRAFELFTFVQGVPNYFEINPTPIYVLLYVIMFGMMFGDIGGGIVLMIIGALLTRLRKGFFAFSLNATKKIARIIVSCGFSAMAFGFLYGIIFLLRTPFPGLLSPLTDVTEIIVIALAFGVAQIMLSLILNVVNMVRRREPLKVILGERGIVGLIFYSAGVVVAYQFIAKKSLDVFLSENVIVFSSVCIVSLALILLSPLIEASLKHEEISKSKKFLEGFGIGLEALIAFIANSVSYIRLAAFAIAHEAIAIAAVVLGVVLGGVFSLVLLNILDFGVEGFASFIQSLRLMYYEFSSRFFLKNGIRYEPFKVDPSRIKV